MLDMGFLPDIQRIIALLPAKRQNLMFSATFADEIRRLSKTILQRPGRGRGRAAQRDGRRDPPARLPGRSRPQGGAARPPDPEGRPPPGARLHPDEDRRDPPRDVARPAGPRRGRDPQRPLAARADAGARGVQVAARSGSSSRPTSRPAASTSRICPHVVNFELPWNPQDYIHRIGRTGRAGRDGRRDQPRLHRRDRPPAGRPAAAPQGDPVDGRGGLRPGSERRAAAAPRRRIAERPRPRRPPGRAITRTASRSSRRAGAGRC